MQSSEGEGSGHLNVCLMLMNYISHWYLPDLNFMDRLELSNEVNDTDVHI